MKRWAQIQGGKVCLVVDQEGDDHPDVLGPWIEITGQHVGPGFTYDGQAFTAPVDVVDWRIKVGAFFNRFGDDTIPLLASTDALIQAWVKLAMAQEYIALDSPKVAGGIDVLKTKPGFNINKDAILNTPPSAAELYRG